MTFVFDWLLSLLPLWMANGIRRLSAFLAALAVGASSVQAAAPPYGFPDCVNGPLKNNTVCDVTKDAITRATALIDLWTDEELTNNTVNSSPGVARLGLPAYNWWSEGLVSFLFYRTATHSLRYLPAWRCAKPRSYFRTLGGIQPCHLLPTAYSYGRRFRRPSHPSHRFHCEYRRPCIQ